MGLNGFIDMPAAGFEPVTYALRVHKCNRIYEFMR
nr:MAG TPA: hypothetical protein [Caudoviricetes sp.]